MKTVFTTLGLIMIIFLKTNAQGPSEKEISKLLASLQNSKADTNKVNRLLQLSNYYIEKIPETPSFKDSALLFSSKSEALSHTLKYKSGVENSYLAQAEIWIKVRDLKIKSGEDGEVELKKEKEVEGKLIEYLKNKNSQSKIAETYTSLGKLYEAGKKNFPEMLRLYKLAISFFQQAGDKKRESEVLFDLGFVYNMMADLPKAEENYLKSIAVAKAAGRTNLQYTYGTLGNVYTFQGNFSLGLKYELEAVRIATTEKDTTQTYGVINLYLGLTYEGLKDRELALKHYKIATTVFEKYSKTNMGDLSSSASNAAKMMVHIDPKAAISFIESFLQRYPHLASGSRYHVFVMRLMQAHVKLKQYDSAQKYCNQLLKNLETNSSGSTRSIYPAVVQFFIVSKQYSEAKKYLSMFQNDAERSRELPNMRDSHLFWYQIDSAEGNSNAALAHYIKYKALSDSILNETKIKEIAKLNIQYESEKKDKDILFKEQSITLLTNEAALQQAMSEKQVRDLKLREKDIELLIGQKELQQSEAVKKDQQLLLKDQDIKLKEKDINLLANESLLQLARLKQTRTIRNVIIGGAVMLLLMLALVYSRYRIKKQTNKEISSKNITLQQLLGEKEWLLKEVHHRVKNNLHTVMSLLESQSAYLENDALAAIQDSQHRVFSMSLIHQKLYQSDEVATIDMAVYLPELVNYLSESFSLREHIRFNLQIEPLELDVSQAIPIGLILNEAITNAIKYAFPLSNNNIITISMVSLPGNKTELMIADNGIGLPTGYNISKTGSLGIKLMRGLTKDIGGEFTVESGRGCKIGILFTIDTALQHFEKSISDKTTIDHL